MINLIGFTFYDFMVDYISSQYLFLLVRCASWFIPSDLHLLTKANTTTTTNIKNDLRHVYWNKYSCVPQHTHSKARLVHKKSSTLFEFMTHNNGPWVTYNKWCMAIWQKHSMLNISKNCKFRQIDSDCAKSIFSNSEQRMRAGLKNK